MHRAQKERVFLPLLIFRLKKKNYEQLVFLLFYLAIFIFIFVCLRGLDGEGYYSEVAVGLSICVMIDFTIKNKHTREEPAPGAFRLRSLCSLSSLTFTQCRFITPCHRLALTSLTCSVKQELCER